MSQLALVLLEHTRWNGPLPVFSVLQDISVPQLHLLPFNVLQGHISLLLIKHRA